MQMKHKRLFWLVLLVIGTLLAACASAPVEAPAAPNAEAPGAESADAIDADSNEAPVLAAQVAAGELPALAERLPLNPKVVTPNEELGRYGGTWHMGLRGGDDNALIYRTIGYEQLMRWNLDWTEVEPNIVESAEVNDDATEFTFHLREGMKWSDGEPLTSNDIMWWYEHVLSDPEVTLSRPNFLTSDVDGESQLATFEQVDDYTFTVTFAQPSGMFLAQLAAPEGQAMKPRPAHWLQQFHPDFNPDVDALAEAEGFVSWKELLADRAEDESFTRFADQPTLHAWQITKDYGAATTQVVAERNPYYWKVDPEGRQLPYIDEVNYQVGDDVNVLVLQAMNGEIDNQARHIDANDNKAVYIDNQEAGGYHLINQLPASSNWMVLNLNLVHKDPAKRELFANKDFRIALSHAINRQEIIDGILIGEGTPHQPAPLPGTPLYNERLATQYTEYDPELANQMLDEIGLTERDSNGFRLGPDGQPLVIEIEVITVSTEHIDALELIERQWAEVGINMNVKVEDRSLFFERHDANEHDGSVWGGEGGVGWDVYISPKNVLPMHNNGSRFALPWAYWFNGSPNAEEPPAEVKAQLALYRQVMSVASDAERADMMAQVLEMAADQFYVMGISTPTSGYRIVSNRMHNVPVMVGSWTWPTPGPSSPEQYFFE